jgi:poly-gamma-glutamate capsule biosynthesis protein CapA/YwtB (metallophosphatase superfamily)
MRLAFVGDIALGDHPKTVGFGFRSRYPRGIPLTLARRLLPPGPAPDLLFGNLEFCLGSDPATAGGGAAHQCRGIDQYAGFLASAGVTVLNVANNHSAQHGHSAFWATAELCRRSGIAVVGTTADFTAAAVIQIGGRRIAFLGWSDRPRQYAPEAPPYNEFGHPAYDLIRQARQRADFVVVSIHWGEEFVQMPTDRERHIAHAAIDAGASIVVGHHPHVLREVEEYAQGLIAYSLGNFVGDMTWNPHTRLGGCLLVEANGADIRSHRLALSRIDADYLPTYLSESDAVRAVGRLEHQRQRQRERIARRGYARAAAAEHRRQVWATAVMMLRNFHRYPRGTLLPMLRGAFRNRMRSQAGTGPL